MIIKIQELKASGGNTYDSIHIDGSVVPDMIVLVSGVAKGVLEKIYQAGKDGKELTITDGGTISDD